MRRIFAVCLLLSLPLWSHGLHAQVRIAAVVNEDVITVQELVERLEFVIATSNLPDEPRTRERLAPQVLRNYIDETLQLQEARRLGIAVTDAEIERAIADLARRNKMTVQQFRDYFASRRLSLPTLVRQIRAQIAWARVTKRVLEPRVVVSREQIEQMVNGRAQRGEEVRLSEILLPVYAPEQEAQVMAQAREIVAALREGADFAALARQVSAAASAEAGGDLGWLPVDGLALALRRVVSELAPGQVSDPLPGPEGVRILLLRDRRSGSGGDEEVFELGQVVVPLPADADEATIASAMRQAQAIRPRLSSCAAADALAVELRAPASGRLGWMRLEELPPEFRPAVAALAKGQTTPPLRGPVGIHVLVLCERGGEQGARALARLQLEREQLERLANRYLRDLRKSAFIDVRL
ncbi:Chaperone SurA [bacterium HR40]|nr:Chaperone SurA [bacterium HR40]